MGLRYYVGPELEFLLLREDKPADNAFYYATAPLDKSTGYRIEMADYIEYFGLLPEYLHHEVALGQQEINFRFGDALTIADGVQVYKLVATHLAEKYGLVATFMPKPFFGMNGSGMHVHQSVFFADSNENAFAGEKEGTLSELAFNFIAGLLKYAPAITAITSPTVNSYKRLVPGYEAPVYIAWGYGNRSALIRVPKYALKSKSRIKLCSLVKLSTSSRDGILAPRYDSACDFEIIPEDITPYGSMSTNHEPASSLRNSLHLKESARSSALSGNTSSTLVVRLSVSSCIIKGTPSLLIAISISQPAIP